ncbi:DEKNAAC102222 [Brettanomyces naardenensis]|uniref:DEKNAAC102222 n=1 Tax=Brettanomyces naardenensis TaxID=13370 RepID=A0A448YLI3_BRENA|nr:DEKNAAC102222 [Brettanomyces naardenensis]
MSLVTVQKRKRVHNVPSIPDNFDKGEESSGDESDDDENDSKQKPSKDDDKPSKHELPGPSTDSDGIPYNYIVIIDAGSKGSRAYVYNYLSTGYMAEKKLLGDKEISGVRLLNKLPYVHGESSWNKKINPGLSSFQSKVKGHSTKQLAKIIGDGYLSKLLKKVSKIVPKEQRKRTPIFIHATAGMRLLEEADRESILKATCQYVQDSTNFYLPDCDSHVNVIEGDEEGLYGFIALNYLAGSLRKDTDPHGLLELGGASTQISFQPNDKETQEHYKDLISLRLSTVGSTEPDMDYEIYSKSFLGYGMYRIQDRYFESLIKLRENEKIGKDKIPVVVDPCMPHTLFKEIEVSGKKYKLVGSSNYEQCQELVYKTVAKDNGSNCDTDVQPNVSKCLFNDTMPAFDFNFENFYGVSGYWDTVSKLLDLENEGKSPLAENYERFGKMYSYSEIEKETSKVCSLNWKQLQEYRTIDKDELSILCFKSTYMISLLHNGLGLTKNGTTEFQVNDQINGSDFTWTLGRAILYASDEGLTEVGDRGMDSVGYYRNTDPSLFIRGSERPGFSSRPAWDVKGSSKNGSGSKNADRDHSGSSLFSILLFLSILAMAFWKRAIVVRYCKALLARVVSTAGNKYRDLRLSGDIENDAGYPLEDIVSETGSTSKYTDDVLTTESGEGTFNDQFEIDDEPLPEQSEGSV